MTDSSPASASSANRRVVAVYDTVRRRRVGTDAFMSPGEGCLDCFVGEPHVCPLLVWTTLTVVEDEHGVCTVAEAS